VLGTVSVAVLCLVVPLGAQAMAGETVRARRAPTTPVEKLDNYDARKDGPARKVLAARSAAMAATPKPGVRELRQQLGMQGIIDLDALTGTPRLVARVDGFLTDATGAAPEQVARDYVKAHIDVFGLTAPEVDRLVLRNAYRDVEGTTHLSFVQQIGGITVFGNGLKAHVAKDGRLIQVDGSPVSALPTSIGAAKLTAGGARDKAVADVFGSSKQSVVKTELASNGKTTFSGGDQAQLVVFETLSGPRLAWQTITMREGWISVIDDASGRTLFRQSMVAHDSGQAWQNYPGAPQGGAQKSVNLTNKGWLPNNSPRLAGNVAHVYTDVNDDDIANPTEEVPPSGPKSFDYPFTPVASDACPTGFVCSWNPNVANSWQQNANQDAVQMFFFLGTFHDHLNAAPISFTRTAGNFEAVDDDAVQGQALDGANTAGGLPDANHIDNANMLTPPDGTPPRMQMFLFHEPGTVFPDEDPFLAGNSGDEADIVYHEYTHGLSNRLVVDANGVSTLGGIQAGSMGEAWSDWYAMDFLVAQGNFTDTATEGELRVGAYVGWGNDLIRTMPVDCPVGSTSPNCAGTPTSGPGGYTYGDFGHVIGRPEVHADGEIWVQTLWDLRKAIGSKKAESLVTRAMELSPANPSYLDMRNSILAADLAVNGGANQTKIWKVFAGRGMGWFAGSVDGDDTTPVEDFSMPPAPNTPTGSLTGTVRNLDTGAPVQGAVVAFGGHNSGFAGDYAAVTDATGTYTISGIFAGTYPKVFSRGPGYDPVVQTVSVGARVNVLNWQLRRDWAAAAGGGSIVAFEQPDYTAFGCGPAGMIDQSQGTGWGSDAPDNPTPGEVFPKFVTIRLPVAINIGELKIDPSNTCGDAGSASVSRFTVETSTDGVTFSAPFNGDFGIANRGRLNTVVLPPALTTNVQFIRYSMISTQAVDDQGAICPANFSGCLFMDSVELAVYGAPA